MKSYSDALNDRAQQREKANTSVRIPLNALNMHGVTVSVFTLGLLAAVQVLSAKVLDTKLRKSGVCKVSLFSGARPGGAGTKGRSWEE